MDSLFPWTEEKDLKMRNLFFMVLYSLVSLVSHATVYNLSSVNGHVTAKIHVESDVSVEIAYKGKKYLMVPHIRMIANGKMLGTNVKVHKVLRRDVKNVLRPVYGTCREIAENYQELRLDCNGDYALVFRAYNEGLAWRFVTKTKKEIIIREEQVEYEFTDNYKTYFHPLMSESDYRVQRLSDRELQPNYSSMPVLVKPDDGVNILLHESDVRGYPCMSMMSSSLKPNTLIGIHPKYPKVVEPGGHKNFNLVVKKTEDYIAKTSGTRTFPWRIVAFAATDKDILNNRLVWLLGGECEFKETDWIKPGKVAWDWWYALNLTGVPFKSGINTNTYKYYIDFASRYGIEYVNLDEGWSDQFDLLKVVDEIDMEELSAYARSRGVGLVLWCVWHTIDRQMPEALAQFEKWGIAGLKVDFMDRDDQLVVEFEEKLLREAAKHHLFVNFHGAYHPNGLERAFPNCVNVEGVKGLEWNKINAGGATPVGAVTIPFIRMFAGPMDYTPGAMSNYNKDDWQIIKKRPMSQGTRCQQLAMYVVYNAPLQMISDSPTNYEKEPKFTKFLTSIPTVWDKTVPLESRVGEYVNVARCQGNTWFVGGMTDWTPRTYRLSLDFLNPGETYLAELVVDGPNADRVGSDYAIIMREVKCGDELVLDMAPGGGYAVRLTPNTDRHDIVVFGDSRVQMGGDWGRKLGRKDVTNAGYGGFTTSHFIWLVGPQVIERYPRICLLQGGTNDVSSGITLERTKQNYRSLVDSLLAHDIHVVMHAVTYPTEKDAAMQKMKVGKIDSLNVFIHQLAQEKGLPCIDLNPLLTEKKRLKAEFALDNVHFTTAGYKMWAQEINRILNENKW